MDPGALPRKGRPAHGMEDPRDIHPLLRPRYPRLTDAPPAHSDLHGRSTSSSTSTTWMPVSHPNPSPEWHTRVFHHPLLQSISPLTDFPTPSHATRGMPGRPRSQADQQSSLPASPVTTTLTEPCHYPQSLIVLKRALERLDAPLPEMPNTLPPHDDDLPPVESDSGTALVIHNPLRWPSPRHISDSEANTPLQDLVVFVDVQNKDGDFVGHWFVGVLQDLGAKVRDV
jgi:hypothetical protein